LWGPLENFQCHPRNQNFYEPNLCYNSNSSGFDQPTQTSIDHQPPKEMSVRELLLQEKLHKALQAVCEKLNQQEQAANCEDLIPIPSESEDTSESDSDLPSCDDFSPINVYEEKSVTFSNPLFDLNDGFTTSDDESLSDEDVPKDNVKIYSDNIESTDSYVSNLDEPALLVTPLSDFNEDECFDPGSDVDEIEFLLHLDMY
ncbi:hypothetical protein Tco_1324040, partial [Tanacetum coccineum]